MLKHQYRISFSTPAFLGNADQRGQWRTPPFKAQLRQWWRVAYAANKNYNDDVNELRRTEGSLFGSTGDGKDDISKSRVRMRLSRWSEGSLKEEHWPKITANLPHPEVRPRPVAGDLYMGFGPVVPRGAQQATLKAAYAIAEKECADIMLALPGSEANLPLLQHALWLMDQYGTVGGRSRNGWGSYQLTPHAENPWCGQTTPLREWKACLDRDWPHAIGKDERPLIWETKPHPDWPALMQTLAIIKISLRTQFIFTTGRDARTPEPRHWLSYPVQNHSVQGWRNGRLPNQLRVKVRPTKDGRLVGVIFHMPHLPPAAFKPSAAKDQITETWRHVHLLLDELTNDVARRRFESISDDARRDLLRPQLKHVEPLRRIGI